MCIKEWGLAQAPSLAALAYFAVLDCCRRFVYLHLSLLLSFFLTYRLPFKKWMIVQQSTLAFAFPRTS